MARISGSGKLVRCVNCGCDRTLTIVGKIREQNENGNMEIGFKRLCIPCLVRQFKIDDKTEKAILKDSCIMKTVTK